MRDYLRWTSSVGPWALYAAFGLIAVGFILLLAFGPANAAEPAEPVTLDQASVQAVAAELALLVDEQAAALQQATQPDMWDNALDHILITFINAVSAFAVVCLIFAGVIGLAWAGGLRSLREVRDAVDEWREFAETKTQLAGMILISGAIVAGLTIHAIYSFLAAVSTPHG